MNATDKIRNLRDVQATKGTWNASAYMNGLYNGLELALSILEDEREPRLRQRPEGGYLDAHTAPDLSGPEFQPVAG